MESSHERLEFVRASHPPVLENVLAIREQPAVISSEEALDTNGDVPGRLPVGGTQFSSPNFSLELSLPLTNSYGTMSERRSSLVHVLA